MSSVISGCPIAPLAPATKMFMALSSFFRSLCWYHQWSIVLLNQEHKEFGWLRTTCVPANHVNIVRIFIKALSWTQRDLFSASHLHHDGAFQHVNGHLRIVPVHRARKACW